MTTDSISDTLTRIRNAQAVSKEIVIMPFSKIRYKVLQILEQEGFLNKVEKQNSLLQVSLKKNIQGMERQSKPGQRIYVRSKDIQSVRGGYGLSLISTSQGIMTNKEARKRKLGGELLFNIW
ncbi:MAG: 30S ribosomal protein S8 [Candidatus Pacebacteria bacterium]|nr:30S ribosomal protein S8 [Candidatus Paceibacterota bacterium]